MDIKNIIKKYYLKNYMHLLYISKSVFVRREDSSVKIKTIQMTKNQNETHTHTKQNHKCLSVFASWKQELRWKWLGRGFSTI